MTVKKSNLNRIPYIDGIRGYLIVSMTVSHISAMMGSNLLTNISHKSLSLFFTGQGFMFISGLMIGYIYCKYIQSNGLGKSLTSSLRRSLRILYYYIAMYWLSALPLLLFNIHSDAEIWSLFKSFDPLKMESFSLFLGSIYRPMMFDIIYLYIIYIGIAPIFVYAIKKGWGNILLGVSFFLWSAKQYEITDKVIVSIAKILSVDPANLFGSFSIFAWQLPFIFGVFLGVYAYRNAGNMTQFAQHIREYIFPYAVSICAAFFVYSLAIQFNLIQMGYAVFTDYLKLDFMTVFNFSCFAVVLFCILNADSTEDKNRYIRKLKKFCATLLELKLFTYIGRNSLLTFTASVILTYWLAAISPEHLDSQYSYVLNTVIILAVITFLYYIAAMNAAYKRRIKSKAQKAS